MKEIWKPIPNFEERYEVSTFGRVRSLMFINSKIVKKREVPLIRAPRIVTDGYLRIDLSRDGNIFGRSIASLVLETFVGPRPAGFQAAHLDGNNKNNYLENLKWVTPEENYQHRYDHGKLRGANNVGAKLTQKQVNELRKSYERYGPKKSNIPDLAKKYSISLSTTAKILSNRAYKDANYIPPDLRARRKK